MPNIFHTRWYPQTRKVGIIWQRVKPDFCARENVTHIHVGVSIFFGKHFLCFGYKNMAAAHVGENQERLPCEWNFQWEFFAMVLGIRSLRKQKRSELHHLCEKWKTNGTVNLNSNSLVLVMRTNGTENLGPFGKTRKKGIHWKVLPFTRKNFLWY